MRHGYIENEDSILVIGGPADGQRCADVGKIMKHPYEINQKLSMDRPNDADGIHAKTAIYRMEVIASAPWYKYGLYVHEDIEMHEALAMLIRAYAKPRMSGAEEFCRSTGSGKIQK